MMSFCVFRDQMGRIYWKTWQKLRLLCYPALFWEENWLEKLEEQVIKNINLFVKNTQKVANSFDDWKNCFSKKKLKTGGGGFKSQLK